MEKVHSPLIPILFDRKERMVCEDIISSHWQDGALLAKMSATMITSILKIISLLLVNSKTHSGLCLQEKKVLFCTLDIYFITVWSCCSQNSPFWSFSIAFNWKVILSINPLDFFLQSHPFHGFIYLTHPQSSFSLLILIYISNSHSLLSSLLPSSFLQCSGYCLCFECLSTYFPFGLWLSDSAHLPLSKCYHPPLFNQVSRHCIILLSIHMPLLPPRKSYFNISDFVEPIIRFIPQHIEYLTEINVALCYVFAHMFF